eukprot:TRINITY_DN2995_c0_g1_i9.p2 TRINITY_DN2995_c0_g1~~TRINITY_DN2995_c0_g1_i9.p2  ORF type:complete len:593 (-),score=98.85 TRINITY_DN2995_c0_g1_i9:413-2167(-)
MSLSNNFLKKQRCNFFTRYSNTITGFRWKVQGCVLSRRPPLRSIYCCATKEIVKETKKEKKGSKPKQEKLTGEDEIRQVRIEKVAGLRKAELNPYAYNFDRTHFAQALQDEYKDLPSGEAVTLDNEVSVCGRIMSRRVMGKLAFANLRDESGSIQLYMDKKGMQQVQEGAFANMKAFLDVGDIVGVKGNIKRTEKGELSVLVTKFQILTKTLLPLPDKWHGLTDVEKRYRQRYLDMIVTPGVADTFRTRAKITSAIRRYLESLGFLEVETPVLESVAGGADARPFCTYHNSLKKNLTLRIATELHLKRMVVGGLERVFEIGRIFRNEGVSARHNPEFTSVELYQAYADYEDMMNLTQDLIQTCAKEAGVQSLKINYQEMEIDLESPFQRASMHDLVKQSSGIDFWELRHDLEATKSAAEQALSSLDGSDFKARKAIQQSPSTGFIINELFEALVENTLTQPTFVMDYPVEISPLAKPHRSKEGLVERFELFVAGRELANSFSELTDPQEQRNRLVKQVQDRLDANVMEDNEDEKYEVQVDEDFLTALEYGLPPTGGMGMGIDRLVMLLTDSASIRDVIAFPLLK